MSADKIDANGVSLDGKTFVKYLGGRRKQKFTVPDGVTAIGDRAFFECSSLRSIALPDALTSIGTRAFYRCSSLKALALPDSVTDIGAGAFSGCRDLETVVLPDGLKRIANGAGASRRFDDNRRERVQSQRIRDVKSPGKRCGYWRRGFFRMRIP